MNNNVKKMVILDNYQNPYNRGLINDESYKKVNINSKSCIDQIDLQLKIKDDKICDIRFDGEACAICTSSTSIMIKELIGKDVKTGINIINNFENMVNEKEYNENILGEGIVFSDIYKQPNRKNCAILTWDGMRHTLEEKKDE